MTQTKTIPEKIEENVLRECSEILMERIRRMSNYEGDEFWRGFNFFEKENITTIAIRKTLQEAQKMFLEEIKSMRKHKDTKLIHNFDGEEIDYLISAKELKSKIGGS